MYTASSWFQYMHSKGFQEQLPVRKVNSFPVELKTSHFTLKD